MKTEYRVRWELDVIAEDAESAARGALTIMRDLDSIAQDFEVSGKPARVTLFAADKGPCNDKRRWEILGLPIPGEGDYDFQSVENITLGQLGNLLREGFIKPKAREGNSPTVDEFFMFLKQFPQCHCFGYIVGPVRSDCRVSIEGIECGGKPSEDLKKAFMQFHGADEFNREDTGLRAWWAF